MTQQLPFTTAPAGLFRSVPAAMLGAVLFGALPSGAPVAAQQPPAVEAAPGALTDALREQRRTLRLEDGRLSGDGADLLLGEGRASQFFLLGEEHGVAEVPQLAAALFRALNGHGYRYLAIETGDGLATSLDSLARQPDPLAALTSWYAAHWPGAPFYTLREEATLLVDAVAASPATPALWGLDYDILADRHALSRLRALAETDVQRGAVDRTVAVADSLFRLAMEQRNPGHVLMFGGPDAVLAELRRAWPPEPESEAARIVSLLEATRRINAHWARGGALESNAERAKWNKRQFARHWEAAVARDGLPPRVMLKFGANHMMRGRTLTDVYDLGNQVAELAEWSGGRSFHVLVMAGDATDHAVLDPTVMMYRPAPSGFQAAAWARPFFEAASDADWTVYDLRPIRAMASQRRFGTLSGALDKVVWGFDAVVVLTGSRPSTMLPVERPW